MASSSAIVLFDGVCNFCNDAVNFLIDHDRDRVLRFASIQSEVGQALLHEHGAASLGVSTMVFVEDGALYVESEAALRIARRLGGAFRLLSPFALVPRRLRDHAYRAFARRRYSLFGRSESCRVPTPDVRARFLDLPPPKNATPAS